MSKKENYFIDRIVYKACLLHDTDKGNRDKNLHTDYADVDITDGRKAGLGAGEVDLLADGGCEHRTKRSGMICRNNRRRRAAFAKRLEDKGESRRSRCPNSVWTQWT